MTAWIVVDHPDLDARALASPDALPQFEARGWVAAGGCADPARVPLRTDAEQAAHDKSEAARIAVLLDPGVAPAASRPSK